ncbi:MAG: NfeD family protein [bacterium]
MSLTIAWILTIIIMVVIEAATVTMVSVWFAIGAAGALICAQLGLPFAIQIAVFIALSLLTIIIFRPFAAKALQGNRVRTNSDAIIGQHALVLKEIGPRGPGEVKIKDRIWRATSVDNRLIQEGSYVQIVAIEGAHVIVRNIEGGITDVHF